MKKSDFISFTYINEEELSLVDRLRLAKMTKEKPDSMMLILFNKQPNFLREYEKVYFAKYLSRECSFYEKDDDVYVAPNNMTNQQLKDFFIPSGSEETTVDELYESIGLGYRNLRVYSVLPGIKYKLIKGRGLTGYPSQDKPWQLLSNKLDLDSNNLIDFYDKSRKLLGPKKCKYAFQCYDQKVTWEEFKDMVDNYTKALVSNGVKEDDVVPICITSTVEAVALYMACDAIGATTFFIDPNETNVDAINAYFNRFDSKITFSNCKNLKKIKEATKGTSISKVFVTSPSDNIDINDPNLKYYSRDYVTENTVPFEEDDMVKSFAKFKESGMNYDGEIKYCHNNRHISLITSTSSSTGEPKLIELSRENIMFELETIKRTTSIHLGPNGINMQTVPFKYPYGFVVSTLISPYVGKTSGLTPDFSLDNYLKFIKMYKPTYIHLVPSLVKNIVKNPETQDWDWSFLRYIICGGDKYETAGKEFANKWFKKHNSKAEVKDASGAAEVTAGQTAATVGKYNVESVGKPMRGTIVKAVDEEGNELPYGHIGKLCYSGGNVMQRYSGEPEKTDEVRKTDENGKTWIVTDSYGFVDNEGFVYMCGRDRDFFITFPKGKPPYKVYTDFVEKIINTCDEVFDSAVVKKPDDEMDCVPTAYIVLKNNVPPEQYDSVINKIRDICFAELDSCAVPVKFNIVESLKTKPSMKTDKIYYINLAQAEYEEEKNKKASVMNK